MIHRCKTLVILAGVILAGSASAAAMIDLTAPGAMEDLRQSNPEHFAQIQAIVEGLRERPERVEGEWLQVNFDAERVNLSELLFLTSMPPRQSLTFTLEDTRYRLYVLRSDLVAGFVPAH